LGSEAVSLARLWEAAGRRIIGAANGLSCCGTGCNMVGLGARIQGPSLNRKYAITSASAAEVLNNPMSNHPLVRLPCVPLHQPALPGVDRLRSLGLGQTWCAKHNSGTSTVCCKLLRVLPDSPRDPLSPSRRAQRMGPKRSIRRGQSFNCGQRRVIDQARLWPGAQGRPLAVASLMRTVANTPVCCIISRLPDR